MKIGKVVDGPLRRWGSRPQPIHRRARFAGEPSCLAIRERATGWQAPITHLIDWVQARPATVNAQIQKDSQQRPTQFIEDGWTVDLSYNDNAPLPNRLILKQALESGQENRITMLIQNR